MGHGAAAPSARSARATDSFLFTATVALVLLSVSLVGYGMFLHRAGPLPTVTANAARAKPTARHARRGNSGAVKAASVQAAPRGPADAGTDRAFPAVLIGGLGLLLAALLGMGLARRVQSSQFGEIHSLLEVEKAAWSKQRDALDAQRDKLSAQLQEAQQHTAEAENLRQYASRQFQEFFRTLPLACFCFAADGKIVRWNAACETLYGIPASEALDSKIWDTLVPEEERETMIAWMNRVLAGESVLDVERRDRNARGTAFLVRCCMVPLRGVDGEIIGGLSAGIDLTENKQFERESAERDANLQAAHADLLQTRAALEAQQSKTTHLESRLAKSGSVNKTGEAASPSASPTQDFLTGLCSHRTFRERLRAETERAHRYQTPLSVIVFDLDGFGAYNEAAGFETGDLALRAVASLIETKIRTVDVAARCDADTFALILPETGEAGTRVAVDRLRAGLAGLEWSPQPLTACFGVALLAPDIASPEALLTRAQEALHGAKSLGANIVAHHGEASFSPTRKPRRKQPVSA